MLVATTPLRPLRAHLSESSALQSLQRSTAPGRLQDARLNLLGMALADSSDEDEHGLRGCADQGLREAVNTSPDAYSQLACSIDPGPRLEDDSKVTLHLHAGSSGSEATDTHKRPPDSHFTRTCRNRSHGRRGLHRGRTSGAGLPGNRVICGPAGLRVQKHVAEHMRIRAKATVWVATNELAGKLPVECRPGMEVLVGF
jgi:hypothetical protein